MLDVDQHEWRALELAWEACKRGTLGIGALMVDADGNVLAEGTNGILADAVVGPLSGSRIAHAEMNVLAQIPPGTDMSGATLYTSLEPCAMCAGALVLARHREIRVVAPDPLMHDLDAIGDRNDWIRDRWAPRIFTTDRRAAALSLLLAQRVVALFDPDNRIIAAIHEHDPEIGELLTSVVADRSLIRLAERDVALADVVAELSDRLPS